VTLISAGGQLAGTASTGGAPITGLCGLHDGTLLTTTASDSTPILRFAADGSLLRRYDVPWPDLVGKPSLARQAVLIGTPSQSRCTLALNMGRGFAVFDGERFLPPAPYLEGFDVPEVQSLSGTGPDGMPFKSQHVMERRYATRGGTASDSLLYLTFEGLSADRGHLIDVYDRAGTYQRSFKSDLRVEGLGYDQGTLFVLVFRDGHPLIAGLRKLSGPTLEPRKL
jgi:hypothetical protein